MNHDDLLEDDDGAVLYFYLVWGIPEEVSMATLANCGWDAKSRYEAMMEAVEAQAQRSSQSPALVTKSKAGRTLLPGRRFFQGYMAEQLLSQYVPDQPITLRWAAKSLLRDLDDQLALLQERELITWQYQLGHYSICRDSKGYWLGTRGSFDCDRSGRWLGSKKPAVTGAPAPLLKDRTKLSNDVAAKAATEMNTLVEHHNAHKHKTHNRAKAWLLEALEEQSSQHPGYEE